MWKVIVTVAILGFAGINAQESCIQCHSANSTDCVYPDLLDRFSQVCNESSGFCFTRVNHDGTTQRGCGSEIVNIDCDDEMCNRCPLISGGSTACNTQIIPVDRLTCYICGGSRNSSCDLLSGNSTVEQHRTICPIYRESDQCVATRVGLEIQRGCLSSMTSVNCGVTHNCCLGHGCNRFEWDAILSGAYSIHSVMKVITIALFGVILGYNNL